MRIVVTGGAGFLGSYVVSRLKEKGYEVFIPRSADYDLRRCYAVHKMYNTLRPDVVIHLAARSGGIGINQKQPGRFLYDNLTMGLEMIEAAQECGLKKFVQVGTVCAYPKFTPVPFKEEDLWKGYPEETNAPYGLAKKMLLVQCQAYRQQYGLNAIYLIPVNLYGPRDNFDPSNSHVIPALIRKCVEAKQRGDSYISVWGTGSASREFLYADDCACAIIDAMEQYNGADPINIGNGSEITMSDLVTVIKKAVGYSGHTVWDATKPDGQPRRCLDTSKAEALFGFRAATSFEDGIRKTVSWYKDKVCVS